MFRRVDMEITGTTDGTMSPYGKLSRHGAVIAPRALFFVDEIPNPDRISSSRERSLRIRVEEFMTKNRGNP